MIGRRAFLLGSAGVALAACSSSPYEVSGTVQSGSFDSRYRHAATGWQIVRPPGHERGRLPVLVALHGRTGTYREATDHLHLDRTLADVVAAGAPPFALAAVDGGDHDYWHPRVHTDPAGMVVHEFLPLLADHGLATRRVAFIGWSMGGYGALYLATVLRAPRVAAVVAESPAIWHTAAQRVEGSFDSDADFDRHAILPRTNLLRGIPLRIDCGDADGFQYVTRDLRAALHPTPAGGIEPGGHDAEYWRTQAAAQLRFVARHLRA